MRGRFSDLTPQSLATLMPYISFWSLGSGIDVNSSINTKLPVETSGVSYVAEYAIFYAVLFDDKELLDDLCEHGVDLEARDSFLHNQTPLEVAAEYGRAGIADSLIKRGATVTKNIKVLSSNPCISPLCFFWTLKERFNNREADYQAVDTLLQRHTKNI